MGSPAKRSSTQTASASATWLASQSRLVPEGTGDIAASVSSTPESLRTNESR